MSKLHEENSRYFTLTLTIPEYLPIDNWKALKCYVTTQYQRHYITLHFKAFLSSLGEIFAWLPSKPCYLCIIQRWMFHKNKHTVIFLFYSGPYCTIIATKWFPFVYSSCLISLPLVEDWLFLWGPKGRARCYNSMTKGWTTQSPGRTSWESSMYHLPAKRSRSPGGNDSLWFFAWGKVLIESVIL